MNKPELFATKSSFWIVFGAIFLFFSIRILSSYLEYQEFLSKPFYFTNATVLTQTKKFKNGRHYALLKLKTQDNLLFYTTTLDTNIVQNTQVRAKILIDDKITFWRYLGTFFAKTNLRVLQTTKQNGLYEFLSREISQAHTNSQIANFYQAIFLAAPLESETRASVARLGVSHLVALSGFHLGILWSVVYGLLMLLYRPLQANYFPYRNGLFDVGIVAIGALAWYVWFVGSPPSLVRAFAMVLGSWIVLLMGMRIVSFSFLALVVVLLLALMPTLVVSLSFWFSVAGVFYIFLLLHWNKKLQPILMGVVVLPVGIFVLMQPIVHMFFGVTTPYQLLSVVLSLVFVPFYPTAIGLHVLGWGDLLDTPLKFIFGLASYETQSLFPFWMGGAYIALSLAAISSKIAWYGVVFFGLVYSLYLFFFI